MGSNVGIEPLACNQSEAICCKTMCGRSERRKDRCRRPKSGHLGEHLRIYVRKISVFKAHFVRLLIAATLFTMGSIAAAQAPASNAARNVASPPRPNAPASFSALVTRLTPAVVNISASTAVAAEDAIPGFPPGSALERFNGLSGRRTEQVRSLGSGFIIDASGIIVTNNHVIEKADSIDVILSNGTTLPAKLMGRDEATDLAVLKVQSKVPLPFVRFANASQLSVGDWVVAIGNPFGLGGSVTAGIVSARNRDIGAGRFDDYIQTDAAINKVNSGGPLFNLAGEVVGVNTVIFSPTGGSVGLGFAVSSDLVSSVTRQLISQGIVKRGFLGVSTQGLDPDLVEGFGLNVRQGAVITQIVPNSPAAKVGLKIGDVITQFGNRPIVDSRTLTRAVADYPIGSRVTIQFLRGGKPFRAEPLIALFVDPAKKAERVVARTTQGGSLGLIFADLSPAARRNFSIPANIQGALITSTEPASDASSKIEPGDVALQIGFVRVENAEDARLRANEAAKSGKPVAVYLWRGGENYFVALRPSAASAK